MRIAVTGACGFVGAHLVRALAARPGVQVTAVGRRPRPGELLETVAYRQLDVMTPSAGDFEAMGAPEQVVHLAWGGLPNYRSLHHFETELPAQYRFLQSLVRAGVRSLLVTGTCYEYGMQCGELDETLPAVPTNAYAYAKDALRKQLQFLQQTQAFQLTWARLFYMYGPGQAPTSLYAQLSDAAARGDRTFPMSRGSQLRDFQPVEHVVAQLADLATAPPAASEIVNICSGQPVSVRELVETLMAQHGWSLELELGSFPYPDYEPLAFWGSSAKLQRLLQGTVGGR